MSDFLVSLNKEYDGKALLRLIKKPYEGHPPKGHFFDYSWGSIAVLEERLAGNKNIIEKDTTTFAWVGDLVMDLPNKFLELFINHLTRLQEHKENDIVSLQTDELFERLNGAFAIVLANADGFCVVTDPLGFATVYVGRDGHNDVVAVGTHPDLVSSISGESPRIDIVSIGEFLHAGTPSFPNTMYKNVKELNPGRLYTVKCYADRREIKDFVYWLPPKELRQGYNKDELSKELENILLSAVRDRCSGKRVGVFLSGGLDSRAVMAAVPKTVECIGLTFCEVLNRETQIARKVAKCYSRDWFPLIRDREFLGNSIINTVKLAGCECDWVDAHAIGFVEDIAKFNMSVILSGVQLDVYLKGYFAFDWVRVKRMRGIMPSLHKRNAYEYVDNLSRYWKDDLKKDLAEQIHFRRKCTWEENVDSNRGSIAEWLISYPFSQDSTITFWPAERRVLPLRLPAMDRRVLDFGFRCPIELKVGGKIFMTAAKNIYGAGSRIPNANDGVRPGSGHWSRLAQRAVRKLQDRVTNVLEKLGKERRIQHAWHDYQKYWQESNKLAGLIQEYGPNLDQFDGVLFEGHGQDLLKRKDIYWLNGFRLLQLAIWRALIDDYRL